MLDVGWTVQDVSGWTVRFIPKVKAQGMEGA